MTSQRAKALAGGLLLGSVAAVIVGLAAISIPLALVAVGVAGAALSISIARWAEEDLR